MQTRENYVSSERGFQNYSLSGRILSDFCQREVKTLKRRLSQYELQTRNQVHSEGTFCELTECEIEGPS